MSDPSKKLATVAQVKKVKDEIVQADWSESDTNSKAYIRGRDVRVISKRAKLDLTGHSIGDYAYVIPRSDCSDTDIAIISSPYKISCYRDNEFVPVVSIYDADRATGESKTFTRHQDRWLIRLDLGEYGTISVDTRDGSSSAGIRISTFNSGYNRIEFTYYRDLYTTTKDPFPFYTRFGAYINPIENALLAVCDEEVKQCQSVKIKDSSTNISQQYTVEVADNTLTLTGTSDSMLYFRFADDSLYKTTVSAPGKATATETKLTVDEVTELVTKAHTTNIVFFSGDSLFPSNKIIVYKVVDAYEAYGYHYFTTIKSDRANATSEAYALCVRSYNRD